MSSNRIRFNVLSNGCSRDKSQMIIFCEMMNGAEKL